MTMFAAGMSHDGYLGVEILTRVQDHNIDKFFYQNATHLLAPTYTFLFQKPFTVKS